MKLSSPIHVLKSKAKKLKAEQSISMTQALNLIAKEEGFNSWSLLASKRNENLPTKYSEILDFFNEGIQLDPLDHLEVLISIGFREHLIKFASYVGRLDGCFSGLGHAADIKEQ